MRILIALLILSAIGIVIWLFSDASEDDPYELAYGDWPAVPHWDSDTLSDARDWRVG